MILGSFNAVEMTKFLVVEASVVTSMNSRVETEFDLLRPMALSTLSLCH